MLAGASAGAMFGASDVIEGVGDLASGITGQGLNQRSYNPIRDTVFGGNELIYAGTEIAVSLGTSAAVSKALSSTAVKEAASAVREAEAAGSGAKVVGDAVTIGNFGRYSTQIDAKVTVVERAELPEFLIKTFKDGHYRTVITNEDITVYRLFGYEAEAGGSFATSTKAVNRIQSKIDSAILPEWKNSLRYEAEIVVPKGTILNIGRVEEQCTTTGTRLLGNADQFLLPESWDIRWIKNIVEVKP